MKKIIATASVCGLSLVFAATTFAATVDISGNGAGSRNHIKLSSKTSSFTLQSNKAKFKNNIGGSSSTGGVDANKNTGGDVSVTTGDSSTTVDVSNTANVNTLGGESLNSCCPCSQSTPDITTTGNGADSSNSVKVKEECKTKVIQKNDAYISNNIWVGASTGDVDANKNTGGSVDVTTGDATTSVTVTNTANSNNL